MKNGVRLGKHRNVPAPSFTAIYQAWQVIAVAQAVGKTRTGSLASDSPPGPEPASTIFGPEGGDELVEETLKMIDSLWEKDERTNRHRSARKVVRSSLTAQLK